MKLNGGSCALDELDKEILRLLQKDGKASLRTLAKATGYSVSAIKNHLNHLTKEHVIKDIIAVIDCCKVGYQEMLLIFLRVNTNARIEKILDDLSKNEEINVVYQISGTNPIFCMAKCVEKEEQLELIEKIKEITGVEEVIIEVVMRRVKEDMRVRIQ